MKNFNKYYFIGFIIISLFLFQGCELIADIFTAGFWVGIALTILVIAIIIWLIIKGLKWLRK